MSETGRGRGPAPTLLAGWSRESWVSLHPALPPQLGKLGTFDTVVSVQLSEMW